MAGPGVQDGAKNGLIHWDPWYSSPQFLVSVGWAVLPAADKRRFSIWSEMHMAVHAALPPGLTAHIHRILHLGMHCCYYLLVCRVLSRCIKIITIKLDKSTVKMVRGQRGQGDEREKTKRRWPRLPMHVDSHYYQEWPPCSPTQNDFLKLDRFRRIMGKFILSCLLHLVICR